MSGLEGGGGGAFGGVQRADEERNIDSADGGDESEADEEAEAFARAYPALAAYRRRIGLPLVFDDDDDESSMDLSSDGSESEEERIGVGEDPFEHCIVNINNGGCDGKIKRALEVDAEHMVNDSDDEGHLTSPDDWEERLATSLEMTMQGDCDINLSYSPIGRISASSLSASLEARPSLLRIKLHHCGIGNNAEILSAIMHSGAGIIELDHNDIGPSGASIVSENIGSNSQLYQLSVSYNPLGDEGADLISEALRRNTALLDLYARCNDFSTVGIKALLKSAFDTSSLNAVADSNHKCKLSLFALSSDVRYRIEEFNEQQPYLGRRLTKIVLALQAKESLSEDIASVPVELMPAVLELAMKDTGDEACDDLDSLDTATRARRYSHEKKALNLISLIFRMPSLFSFHGTACPKSKRARLG